MSGLSVAVLLGFYPLVKHTAQWGTGRDLWGMYRAAQYVSWGDLGGVYTAGTGVVTLPGFSILLAPFAWIGDRFGLSASVPPYFLSHPTSMAVIEPALLLYSAPVIVVADRIAARARAGLRRRYALAVLLGVACTSVLAIWAHVEDLLATALVIMVMEGMARRARGASNAPWLMGVAIALQPIALLASGIAIEMCERGKRLVFVIKAAVIPTALVAVAMIGNWSDAWNALLRQPTPPTVNRPTPWVSLSPRIGGARLPSRIEVDHLVRIGRHFEVVPVYVATKGMNMVSGGPVRVIGVVLAVVFGAVFVRRRVSTRPMEVVWLTGVVFAIRCSFEPVMTPYYLVPPIIAFTIVLVSLGSRYRMWAGVAAEMAVGVGSYLRLGPWLWYSMAVGGLAALAWLARPAPSGRSAGDLVHVQAAPHSVRDLDAASSS